MSGPRMRLQRKGQEAQVLEFPESADPFSILEKARAMLFPGVQVLRWEPEAQEAPPARPKREIDVGGRFAGSWDEPAHDLVAESQAPAEARKASQPSPKPTGPSVAAGVRDTSRSAYAALRGSAKLSKQQELVLAHFRAHQGKSFTRQEIAKALGLGINAVCGRVNELMREPFALLHDGSKRRCSVTGSEVHALDLVMRTDSHEV